MRTSVHRLVYIERYGNVPDDLVVRHKCDNPACINIEHLELGTHGDNVGDRVSRNRSAVGAKHGRSKLTESDVRFIRSNNNISNSELARMFNVDRAAIRRARSGKTWKCVS